MGVIQGVAQGRYGAWVIQARTTVSPVSSGAYFNIHSELWFVTTGTATISVSARGGGAYINLFGNVRYFNVPELRGSFNGGIFLGSMDVTLGADGNGNCAFGVEVGYNVKATLDGNYVAWISGGGTDYGSGVTPSCSISATAHTDTTMTFNWSSNINSDLIHMYSSGNVFRGSHGLKIGSTVSGLTPNTTYNFYGFAHNTYGFGPQSNVITVKTYPSPVSIASTTVTDITPFTCTLSTSSSNSNTTNAVEYSIYDSTGTNIIKGPFVLSPVQWIYYITDLQPETTYVAKFRVRTSESNIWSNYASQTFMTLTDQAAAYIKANNIWLKGKLYEKIDGVWTPAKKLYIKKDNNWSLGNNN